MDVLAYRPEPAELCWTFGGVPPVRRVRPGTVLELWTEDAFGGRVRGPDDLLSRVVEFPFVNPQTGPFYVAAATSPSRCRLTPCTAPSGWRRPPSRRRPHGPRRPRRQHGHRSWYVSVWRR